MTGDQLRRVRRAIYRRLHDPQHSWRFAKVHGWYGLCFQGRKKIRINPVRGDLIDTLVHEVLHDFHKDWPERKVRRQTKVIMRQLSYRTMSRMMLLLSEALCRSHVSNT